MHTLHRRLLLLLHYHTTCSALAQERIIQGRGAVTASHTTTCDSKLVAALTSSSVLKVQRQQATLQQATRAPHAGAVLDVLLQHWQKLMQERLHAAQMLLPDIPLASAPRSQLEVDDNSDVAHSGSSSNSGEAWRDIGQQQSPWVTGADAAPACIKLLYTADDLLQMLTTVVTVVRIRRQGLFVGSMCVVGCLSQTGAPQLLTPRTGGLTKPLFCVHPPSPTCRHAAQDVLVARSVTSAARGRAAAQVWRLLDNSSH